MPHVDIQMLAGRDESTKERVAKAVTATVLKELGCDPSHLSVAIHDFQKKDWNTFADTVNEDKIYTGKLFKFEE
ncbi:MAG: tautomerase family protein [Eubacteriales bacterium]|nr:tautomerase family protein [Eubacteriales bacterium]MDY3332281.1 tautomerase family protein [Gallibacter sp.]